MSISRRELITGACAAGAAGLLGGCSEGKGISRQAQWWPGRHFTFVHLTDQHVTTRRNGAAGYRACIDSINALRPRPAFVLMGGDMAWDGNYTSREVFEESIRVFKETSDRLAMPWYPCMGNHDTLGLSERRKVPLDDPELGKKMIMNRLNWARSYYSFDFGGWHFVVLDSTHEIDTDKGPGQEARIGDEQLYWLAYDLGRAAGRPSIAVTHIAAFCNVGQISGDPKHLAMSGMVVADTKELRRILERHKVKALLQGHSHRIEEYRFNGVWYLTSAAGGGAWWTGSWTGSPPGYTVFTCDGDQLSWRHVSFPWVPQLDPQDEVERKKNAEQREDEEEQARRLCLEQHGVPYRWPQPKPASQPASQPTSQASQPAKDLRGRRGRRGRRDSAQPASAPRG